MSPDEKIRDGAESSRYETRAEQKAPEPFPVDSGAGDVVETALANALTAAATAGRFDVVQQLARELEARRNARTAPNVVPIDTKRRRST